jgi:uncharacterized protein
MHVLITGGTGMIGKPFAKALLNRGHSVTVLSRNPDISRVPAGVEVQMWDGRTSQGWGSIVNNVDGIVNLAGENLGEGRWTAERKRQIRESRLNAGRAVVTAVQNAQKKPEVLLQASAVGYYGPVDDRVVDEMTPAGKDFPAQICVDWEASTLPVETMGVRRVVLRTGIVLDSQKGALQRLLLPFRLFVGGPLGSGKQWWPWISLADQIEAMCYLLENKSAVGPYNLTAPNPLPMSEFGRELAKTLHRPFWLPVPAFGLKMLLGEMSTIVLDGQRAVPKKLLALGFEFRYRVLSEAFQDLFSQVR